MYQFIPLAIALLALAVLIVIAVRRVPKLKNLPDASAAGKGPKAAHSEAAKIPTLVWHVIARGWKAFARISFRLGSSVVAFAKGVRGKKVKSEIVKEEAHKQLGQLAQEQPMMEDIPSQDEVEGLIAGAAKALGAKEYAKAEKLYIEVVTKDPKNIAAYRGLGEVYEALGNAKDAIESFRQVLKLNPEDTAAEAHVMRLSSKPTTPTVAADASKK